MKHKTKKIKSILPCEMAEAPLCGEVAKLAQKINKGEMFMASSVGQYQLSQSQSWISQQTRLQAEYLKRRAKDGETFDFDDLEEEDALSQ